MPRKLGLPPSELEVAINLDEPFLTFSAAELFNGALLGLLVIFLIFPRQQVISVGSSPLNRISSLRLTSHMLILFLRMTLVPSREHSSSSVDALELVSPVVGDGGQI
jgi:hypothetical protein